MRLRPHGRLPRCGFVVGSVVAIVAAGLAGSCSANRPPGPPEALGPRVVRSNVARGDYVGSDKCAPCHADVTAAWASSPMRRMTRTAGASAPTTPFDGRTLTFKGDRATLETHRERPFVRIERRTGATELFEITKVIGGRYREDFVGVRVGHAAPTPPVPKAREEEVLPVSSLLFADGELRYKGYSVQITERDGFPSRGARWSTTCVFCHNTVPVFATLYDDLHGGGLVYQGAVSDDELPDSLRMKVRVTDEAGLEEALVAELRFLGEPDATGSSRELLERAVQTTRRRFSSEHLVEVGIGCEACHNGAREHVEDPRVLPTFELRSSFLRAELPGATPASPAPASPAQAENRTCARCHTVLFSRYEPTWEGGGRSSAPGGSTINSGEARDFLLGGCADAMRCSTCHDPHGADDRDALKQMATPAGNAVCSSCHEHGHDDASLFRHTKHPIGSSGTACVACHMPAKNMGLALEPSRYHRIGSPTEPERAERDRPLECALCHEDESVETLAKWMGDLYDRAPDPVALRRLYGEDLSVRVLDATLERGLPHERAVAASAVAKRGAEAVDLLIPALADELPLVRHHVKRAIERASGRKATFDVDGPEAVQAAREWWGSGADAAR